MIKITNLSKHYSDSNKIVKALDEVNLELPDKGMVFVTGKSGSGKTTLLYILGGLTEPTSGNVIRDDHISDSQEIRSQTGFVFQNYNLFNDMSVYDNLLVSATIKDQILNENEIDHILNQFDIVNLKGKKTANLSGGEQQRVAIARAISHNPSIVLVDEPTGNLDEENARIVNEALKEISKSRLVLYVTHDIHAANQYGDQIIELSSGKVHRVSLRNSINGPVLNRIGSKEKNIHNVYCLMVKFANKFLFLKPARFILTIISFIISSLLFLMVLSLSNYNEDLVVANYLDEYQVHRYVVYENKSYLDLFNQNISSEIYSGETLFKQLSQDFESSQIAKIKLGQYSPDFNQQVNIFYINQETSMNDLEYVKGNMMVSNDQITISDYLALANELEIGDSIDIVDRTFTIVGIFKTDYIETNYIAKKIYGYLSPIDQYAEKYNYLSVYLHEGVLQDKKDKHVTWIPNNFIMKNPSLQISLAMTIGVAHLEDDLNLLHGRLPSEPNDALISSYYAVELGLIENSIFQEESYYFYNFSDLKFKGSYADKLNLYDYYPEGINFVGVVDDSNDFIYLQPQKYNEILNSYFDYYYTDEYMIIYDQVLNEKQVKSLDDTIRFNEPMISMIYSFQKTLISYTPILTVLLILFTMLTVFMLMTLFLNAFYQGMKDIAIMQCLGLSQKKLVFIFVIQMIEIVIISSLFLFVLYNVSIYSINVFFNQTISLKEIKIYLFDGLAFSLTFLKMLLISLILNCFLIYKILKTDTINVLRNI